MLRFYGPFAASLPSELSPILSKYCAVLEFDDVAESGPFLFHPPQGNTDRSMESSAWSQWVSRLFQRHAGVAIAPKTLRSIFITWLRDNTADDSILKSAAHAMKHSENRQASADYDQVQDSTLLLSSYMPLCITLSFLLRPPTTLQHCRRATTALSSLPMSST